MTKQRTEVLGIRVRSDLYNYYVDYLNRIEKGYVADTLKAIFEQMVSDIKKKKESGEPFQPAHQGEHQLVVKVEHTLKAEDSTLRIYRRMESLEKELARALESLQQSKEELEKERAEKDKCLKELDAAKRKPEAIEKELQRREMMTKELLELASIAIYCFETQRCEHSKALNVLRNRLSRMGLEPPKLSDVLISLISPK